jgi:hypothetical protein
VTAVVTAGGNGVVDSVANTACGVGGPPAFCNTATARINNAVNSNTFITPYSGAPFVVDGGLSTLDKCESGSIQYEFTRCNTNTIGAACDAPANGTIIQGFSSDGQITTFPTADTRYRLRVRCSSQAGIGGCGATAGAATDVLVGVFSATDLCFDIDSMSAYCSTPGDSGNCSVTPFPACTVGGAACAGGGICIAPCDASDALQFSFTKPQQGGNLSGFNLYRGTEASLNSSDIPVVDALTCLIPTGGFGAAALVGATVIQPENPVTVPADKAVNVYLVSCRRIAGPPGVGAPAGEQHPTVTGSGTNNPAARRYVAPQCP